MYRVVVKGISSVIAILLIILIVVSASIITYQFVIGFTQAETESSQPETMNSMLKCEGVEFLPSGGLRLYVRNIGDSKGSPLYMLVYVFI